mgnify:CR=1 FL=1
MLTLFRRIQDQELDLAGCLLGQTRVDVFVDSDEASPLDGDVTKLVCFHHKYKVGTKNHGFFQPSELADFLDSRGDGVVVLPVYMLHDDKVRLSTQRFDRIHEDISCLIGFAYVTKEDADRELVGWEPDDVKSMIELSIEQYENWLNKSKYSYSKSVWDERSQWKLVEENYNFEGTDFEANGLFRMAGLVN